MGGSDPAASAGLVDPCPAGARAVGQGLAVATWDPVDMFELPGAAAGLVPMCGMKELLMFKVVLGPIFNFPPPFINGPHLEFTYGTG